MLIRFEFRIFSHGQKQIERENNGRALRTVRLHKMQTQIDKYYFYVPPMIMIFRRAFKTDRPQNSKWLW